MPLPHFFKSPDIDWRLARLPSGGGFWPLVVLLVFITGMIWIATLLEITDNRDKALKTQNLKNANLAVSLEDRTLRSLEVLDQALRVIRHNYLSSLQSTPEPIRANRHPTSGNGTSLAGSIKMLQFDHTGVGVISIIGPNGDVVETTVPGGTGNFADRDYFRYHAGNADDALLLGKPILGKFTGRWLITLTRRIELSGGGFGGVVFMALDPLYFVSSPEPTEQGVDSTVSLIGLDGVIRVRNSRGDLSYGEDISASQLFSEIKSGGVGQYSSISMVDGMQRVVSYRVLKDYPLVVTVSTSLEALMHDADSRESTDIGLALLFTAMVIAMGSLVNRAWVQNSQALMQVQASERKFRSIIDVSPVPMALNDDKFNITYVNPAFSATFGYTLEHIPTLHQWWPQAYPDVSYREQMQQHWNNEMARVNATGEGFRPVQAQVRCLDGTDRQVLASADKLAHTSNGEHLVVLYDITSQMKSVQALNKLVKDKNALLKEVNHRVKNNLQVISSLLRLEAHRIGAAEVANALNDMRWRIRSMALMHESLYRSVSYASIDLGVFIGQLANELVRALTDSDSRINLVIDTQPVHVSMDQATPCGLIFYELFSNALKHGFPSGRIGLIKVGLNRIDGGRVCLTVSDNGVGLPADFDLRKTESLGLQLVSDLSQQLAGKLTIGPGPDAAFSIEFSPDCE